MYVYMHIYGCVYVYVYVYVKVAVQATVINILLLSKLKGLGLSSSEPLAGQSAGVAAVRHGRLRGRAMEAWMCYESLENHDEQPVRAQL